MADFRLLAENLKVLSFSPSTIVKETMEFRSTYEFFSIDTADREKMVEVAKRMEDKSFMQKFFCFLSSYSFGCIKKWASRKLAVIGENKIQELFPEREEHNPQNINEYYVKTRSSQIYLGISLETLARKIPTKEALLQEKRFYLVDALYNKPKSKKA